MKTKHAGGGAALAVLLAFMGLIVLVGVILLLMWEQPDIEHSPLKHQSLANPVIESSPSFWRAV